jgi:glycosyltransferase involved in cell wall biosynthesis
LDITLGNTMVNLSIITITNGDLAPLERTTKSFHPYDGVEWIVISAQNSFPQHLRKPDLFIGNETHGIFSAINLGLEKSTGKLVVFMNAGDEFFEPNTIKKVLDSWYENKWEWAIGVTHLHNRYGKSWKYPKVTSLQFFFGTNSFCHQAMYCETELLRNFGGFNADFLGADWALMLKLSKQIAPSFLDFPVAIYEHGGVSTKQSYLKECLQKHSARKFYRIGLKPAQVDLILQFLITFISRLIQKAKG